MRKEYVKPVMESEEFVSNEYVAACYTIDCNVCSYYDEVKTLPDGSENGELIDKSGCTEGFVPSEPDTSSWGAYLWWAFLTYILGYESGEEYSYHPISVTKGWAGHPNASV